ncbi:MAG: hypothetical protein WB421_07735 [Terriglobales bacterium]
MLYKCANPPCVNLFRSMHQGKLFVVESESQDSQGPEPTNGTRKNRPLHRVEHYWLCNDCFPVVTLTFSKGLGLIMVPLLPPQLTTAPVKKPVNSLRRSELLSPQANRQPEMA